MYVCLSLWEPDEAPLQHYGCLLSFPGLLSRPSYQPGCAQGMSSVVLSHMCMDESLRGRVASSPRLGYDCAASGS